MQRRKFTALHHLVQPTLIALTLATSGTYAAPGDLDTSFAGKGWTTAEIGTFKDAKNVANDTVVQPDGKILTVGSDNNGLNDDLSLTRFNTDGTLDTSFDGDVDFPEFARHFVASGNTLLQI